MGGAEPLDANGVGATADQNMALTSARQGRVGNFVNLVHYIGQLFAFHLGSAAADAKRHNLDHVALLGLCGSSIPLVINTVFGCKLCAPTLAAIEVLVALAIGIRVWRYSLLGKYAKTGACVEIEPADVPETATPTSSVSNSGDQAVLPTDTAARMLSASPTAKRNKVPTPPPQGRRSLASIACPLSSLRAGPLRSLGSSGSSDSEPTVVLSGDPRAILSPTSPPKADGLKRRRNTLPSKPNASTSSAPALTVVTDAGMYIAVPDSSRRPSLPDASSRSAPTKASKSGGGFSTRCATSAMLLRAFGAHPSKSTDIISS